MKIVKYCLIIFVFMALVLSCESIQSATTAITKASEEITAEEEYYIGRAVAANIMISYKPYTVDESLTSYLNQICRAITINSDRPDLFNGYHLMVLDSEEINAFATSGGHIFVTKGLIRSANSEDALAGIIAHEIAHVQLQHSVIAIKASRKTDAWVSSGVAIANIISVFSENSTVDEIADVINKFDSDINGAISNLVDKGYSRDQEYQADDLALKLMSVTGYDPFSYVEMLRSLKASQAKALGGFNSTHPTPDARIENVEKSINNYAIIDSMRSRSDRFEAFMRNI
jgi:predicted Zn-dependent protease